MWLTNHPLLNVLGHSGRKEVLDQLLQDPGPWSMRQLARQTGLHATTVQRAIQDFALLGIIEHLQPGRAHHITLRDHPFVRALKKPWPVVADAVDEFQRHLRVGQLVWWMNPNEVPLENAPLRLAIVHDDEDEVWDAVPEALDALQKRGWAEPEILPVTRMEDVPGIMVA